LAGSNNDPPQKKGAPQIYKSAAVAAHPVLGKPPSWERTKTLGDLRKSPQMEGAEETGQTLSTEGTSKRPRGVERRVYVTPRDRDRLAVNRVNRAGSR